jgi:hypothetical protein
MESDKHYPEEARPLDARRSTWLGLAGMDRLQMVQNGASGGGK